jgi:hypothetical protein
MDATVMSSRAYTYTGGIQFFTAMMNQPMPDEWRGKLLSITVATPYGAVQQSATRPIVSGDWVAVGRLPTSGQGRLTYTITASSFGSEPNSINNRMEALDDTNPRTGAFTNYESFD